MSRIASIPCKLDGIQFRSRLEACWHSYFKRTGFSVEYEPLQFEIRDIIDTDWRGIYVPDFRITGDNGTYFVEIKPLLDCYEDKHDIDTFRKAYILGYTHPTIIVLGSPIKYFAACCTERHKGHPFGSVAVFTWTRVWMTDQWCLTESYPDEDMPEVQDPREGIIWHSDAYRQGMQPAANDAWNDTQWRK